jgi:hypothetical protein
MSRFNNFMNSHFSGCQLLAKTRDLCRQRDVSVFRIPGEVECVGVSDGTDSWIAPVIANPFSFDLIKLFKDFADGIPVKLPLIGHQPSDGPVKSRRKLLNEDPPPNPPPSTRKQLLVDPGETQIAKRTRASVNFN